MIFGIYSYKLKFMNLPFKYIEPKKLTLLDKLLFRTNSSNCLIEINNLIHERDILSINAYEIDSINAKYKNSYKSNYKEFLVLYETFINYAVSDGVYSQQEIETANHLKYLLKISDQDARHIFELSTELIYSKHLKEVIKDGEISTEENIFLTNLKESLFLDDKTVEEINASINGKFVTDFLTNAISDQRLSEDEEKQLEKITKNLNVNLQIDNKTQNILDKYKLFWKIENGDIPIIDCNLSLPKNEFCYFRAVCDWYEIKKVTKKINYSGVSASIKIMKGVRYRVGSITPVRVTSEEMVLIGSGSIFITNKKIQFVGSNRNSNIKIQSIVSFTPFSDGIEISKTSGNNVILKYRNAEISHVILSSVLNLQ